MSAPRRRASDFTRSSIVVSHFANTSRFVDRHTVLTLIAPSDTHPAGGDATTCSPDEEHPASTNPATNNLVPFRIASSFQ